MAYETTPSVQDVRASFQRRAGRPAKFEKAADPRKAMVRLLKYLGPFKSLLILVVGFIVLYSLLGLAGPYLMGRAIDKSIGGKDLHGLLVTALLMLAAYFLSNFFNSIANLIMARISQNALKNLRGDLFAHIQTLSMRFFDTHPAGGLMSRLTNDIDAINQTVSQNIISLIASILTMIGILVSMFILNHWLALASLVVIPIMYWFSNFIAKYTRKGFRELQKDLGELNAVAEETVSGFKVIKAFRRNESAIETFRQKNNAVFKSAVYANSYAMLLMPLTGVLGSFFVIVLASLGGWLALKELVSIGMIATFINYAQNFTSPLRQLSNLYNSIQAALAGAERVFEIIDTKPETPDLPDAVPAGRFKGEVSLRNVVFGYNPERVIIRNFSLEIPAGRTIALVGPTGAGKTTITSLLTRFYDIQEGQIRIDGIDIRAIRKADLRRNLALVLQDTFLFADTILENIRFGRLDATDKECFEAARMAEADHFIRQLPEGYHTNLSERAGNLSQGQRQLLSIARAILANPSILILDEATSSVDTRTELRIQKALLRLMEGRTSIVIAHRLSTIRDADSIVVINNGEIVEQGNHEELLERRGFYHHLYMSQFKGNEI
ncbi:MAG: ABC transporter ATP-binding protein [Rectinema subterraneum]|uniref:ABC transporter ATP-binding protein n=1 Tax=Rectinema subterraneum TaxID=2653714 RepID=UPI003C7B6B69